ncbi:hypothetical protein TIFTF001_022374 [Ficus carica]|uniref:Uncharacterized protein n=1 Tax=Ficus carica TaxID=3494 RepID=A0AA88DFG5_FICCA|nr:hypothetical protein TIFTF001_022374 [Ficus carica]
MSEITVSSTLSKIPVTPVRANDNYSSSELSLKWWHGLVKEGRWEL